MRVMDRFYISLPLLNVEVASAAPLPAGLPVDLTPKSV